MSLALVASAAAADIALYDSGPAQDAAFVRFVNAGARPVSVTATGSPARLALTDAHPASSFLPVRGGSAIQGAMTLAGKSTPVDLTVAPGQFATVVGTPGPSGSLLLQVLRETPDDFNALKAAVAFYGAAPGCAKAGLQVAGKAVDLFRNVAPGSVTRRLINPVALSVQLVCNGKPMGAPLSLGTLVAGQRYSVFAVESDGGGVASGPATGPAGAAVPAPSPIGAGATGAGTGRGDAGGGAGGGAGAAAGGAGAGGARAAGASTARLIVATDILAR